MDRNIEKHELEIMDIIREDDSFWWRIGGGSYKEIPQYLFDALKRYSIEKTIEKDIEKTIDKK
tara:strand:+ start:63 stop:251 length:189 start_codon:yes stop_codon:yes gene_type:complete